MTQATFFQIEKQKRHQLIEELQSKLDEIKREMKALESLDSLVGDLIERNQKAYSNLKEKAPELLPEVAKAVGDIWRDVSQEISSNPPTDSVAESTSHPHGLSSKQQGKAEPSSPMPIEAVANSSSESPEDEGGSDDKLPSANTKCSVPEEAPFAVGDPVEYQGKHYTIVGMSVKESVVKLSDGKKVTATYFSQVKKVETEKSATSTSEKPKTSDTLKVSNKAMPPTETEPTADAGRKNTTHSGEFEVGQEVRIVGRENFDGMTGKVSLVKHFGGLKIYEVRVQAKGGKEEVVKLRETELQAT